MQNNQTGHSSEDTPQTGAGGLSEQNQQGQAGAPKPGQSDQASEQAIETEQTKT